MALLRRRADTWVSHSGRAIEVVAQDPRIGEAEKSLQEYLEAQKKRKIR